MSGWFSWGYATQVPTKEQEQFEKVKVELLATVNSNSSPISGSYIQDTNGNAIFSVNNTGKSGSTNLYGGVTAERCYTNLAGNLGTGFGQLNLIGGYSATAANNVINLIAGNGSAGGTINVGGPNDTVVITGVTGNVTSGVMTSGIVPVATAASNIENSTSLAGPITLDVANSGTKTLDLGNTNATAINIGHSGCTTTVTGTLNSAALTASTVLSSDASKNIVSASTLSTVNLDSAASGTVDLGNTNATGINIGTGATTAIAIGNSGCTTTFTGTVSGTFTPTFSGLTANSVAVASSTSAIGTAVSGTVNLYASTATGTAGVVTIKGNSTTGAGDVNGHVNIQGGNDTTYTKNAVTITGGGSNGGISSVYGGSSGSISQNQTQIFGGDGTNAGTLLIGAATDTITISTANTTTTAPIIFSAASVPSSGSNDAFKFTTAGGNCVILSNATGTITVSDEKRKKHIQDCVHGLDFINLLRSRSYRMKSDSDDEPLVHGLIWQEVEKIVDKNTFGALYQNGDDRGLNYTGFIAPMIRATQELDIKIKAQNEIIAKLLDRLDRLESK